MQAIPWYAGYDGPAPLDCDAAEMEPLAESLQAGLAAAGVRLAAVRSRAIFAEEFNDLVERYGSKGEALSHADARPGRANDRIAAAGAGLGDLRQARRAEPLRRRCWPSTFPNGWSKSAARDASGATTSFGPPDRRVKICFRTKAESCLPAALASMASKYLRELAMQAFNDFWRRRVPGLRPTAGYPARRETFSRRHCRDTETIAH